MKRYVDLEEISDGKKYGINDMVKADCHGCDGCSKCCQGMGNSIVLDPYDIYNMKLATGMKFAELLSKYIELNVVDGVVLPNISMKLAGKCGFLDENGRCSIHKYRPGICRLFPLGRIYEDGDYKYILQTNECEKKNQTKIKVGKWIDIKNQKAYHDFVVTWHYFLNGVQDKIISGENSEENSKLNMDLLNSFFIEDWEKDADFFDICAKKMQEFVL